MKLKALLISALAIAVAVPTVAGAASGGTTRDSITGGGQAFFDERDPAGAGDTIAFQAQRAKGAGTDSTDATGQIQVRRRGDNAVKFHGEFDCLVVNSDGDKGWAYASGVARDGVTPFELYVEDGGKGQLERNDMIMLFYGTEETDDNDGDGEDVCGFSDTEFDTVGLARGNVQARDRSGDENAEPESQNNAASQESAPLSLLGL